MLSTPSTADRRSVGLPLLCLLLLLAAIGARTCGPAPSIDLPAVKPTVSVPKPPDSGLPEVPVWPVVALSRCPEHVRKVVDHLRTARHWSPLRNYKGNTSFLNNMQRLPTNATYRKYDVLPYVKGVRRSAERVVVDAGKRNFYYTKDHYDTFIKIELP